MLWKRGIELKEKLKHPDQVYVDRELKHRGVHTASAADGRSVLHLLSLNGRRL